MEQNNKYGNNFPYKRIRRLNHPSRIASEGLSTQGEPIPDTAAPPLAPPIRIQPKSMNMGMMMMEGEGRMGVGVGVPLNVPPGLQYLAQLDTLFVKQKVELLEVILGCEMNNKYVVKDAWGRDIFKVKEDTDYCTRQCCGNIRPFEIFVKDLNDQPVIQLKRPLACGGCCFPCCLQSIEIFSPPGELCGTVEQEWSLIIPHYVVKDAQGQPVLRIKGPCCQCALFADVEFRILSVDGGVEVGKISKKWSGLLKEAFTDADNFGITLDVRMKAVMVGAMFLIDFMFFESSNN